MTPRPKTARRTRAPPLKRFRKPSTPDAEAELSSPCRRAQLTPGTGTLAPIWYRAMTASVKTTLLRRSGTLKMLASRESMALPLSGVPVWSLSVHQGVARRGRSPVRVGQWHPLDATPGGGDRRLGRLGERVRRDADGPGEGALAEDLDQRLGPHQTGLHQALDGDLVGLERGERG